MAWKKGQSGNPSGKKPVLLPEVRNLIDRDKNAVRVKILELLNLSEEEFQGRVESRRLPMIERVLVECIDRIKTDGDIQKLKVLLEIPLGKLPEESSEIQLSSEEKDLIARYRTLKDEASQKAITRGPSDPGGSPPAEPGQHPGPEIP